MPGLNWQRAKKRQRISRWQKTRPMSMSEVPAGKSGYRGVRLEKNRFRAVIEVNGVRKHLGYFDDPIVAAQRYDLEAIEAWGDAAPLNFPRLRHAG